MEYQDFLILIEEMIRKGELKKPSVSSHISMKIGAKKIDEVYDVITKENMIVLLRSIMKQYKNFFDKDLLKMEAFEEIMCEKHLENEMLIKLFKACILEEGKSHIKACNNFIEMCDLLHKKY